MLERSILIIDDEKRMTDSLRDFFVGVGFDIQTVNSYAEAIKILDGRKFPLIVTDPSMDGVDGHDVIRHIHDHYPKTLMIVITGIVSTESVIDALHYRVFDYIQKPFEFELLKAAVDRAFHELEVDQLHEDTAAMITHDIKVPLTSIIGYAALIHDGDNGKFHPRAVDYLDTIQSNAQKILSLVDNYLTTCQHESDTLVLRPKTIKLSSLIQDLCEMIANEAQRNGFEIDVQLCDTVESGVFDEPLVYRALSNLLQNAIKYGDPIEPIELIIHKVKAEASPLGKEALRFEVSNLAPELHPDILDHLFGRFTRAHNDGGIEGSGIGLYVVDAVARAHGGLPEARFVDESARVYFSILLPLDIQLKHSD